MKNKSYFNLTEWTIILGMALASALLNTYFPSKEIVLDLGVPGPAAGMALLGGLIFVFWIYVAALAIPKKYGGIVTAVIIACVCLLLRPWYEVLSPSWFSVYGIASLLSMGVIIELTVRSRFPLNVIGGGLANVSCLVVTWLAIGLHKHIWIPNWAAPLVVAGAFISGCLGAWLALSFVKMAKKHLPKLQRLLE